MTGVDLRLGDCLDVMGDLAPGSIDLILADLPYGSTQCRWDVVIPFEPLWAHYRRLLKPRGAVVLTASQPFTSLLVMSNKEWFRHEWIWQKCRGSNFANTIREPFKEHESVLFFSDGQWTYNPQMQRRNEGGLSRVRYVVDNSAESECYRRFDRSDKEMRSDWRVPSSVQKFTRDRGLHPNQKPVALMEYLIRTYSNEGETVLDNCFGSCTTGVACVNAGRNFIGIERDADYFRIASDRLSEVTNAMPLFPVGAAP